ncbi:MAG TPA: AtpZ/AtpI family protein [Gemmatimonadaceae bacterium]|nr:AtpZ/AtpI family protein [Gemmatimonadaceae bacterium]
MTTPDPGAGKGDPGMHSGMEFAGVGLQFAAAILLFLYVGKWVDGKLGTAPLFLIVGVFVGAGGGFYSMYRKLVKPSGGR